MYFFKIILFLTYFSFSYSQRVVGYYPQWVQSEFPVSNIDLSVVTHVNHAFAWPDENGNIESYNNMFNISNADIIHNGGRKFLLSLGGWGNDVGFATVASSLDLRTIFIDNLIQICDTYGYDGIDIDWEYPFSESDRENLNSLISEMDAAFNSHNPNLLITMAIPISNWAGQWYDFNFLKSYIDFFNAMTYDIHGGWSAHAGHNSPLYPSPTDDPDGSCNTGINYLHYTRGIPTSQINLGMPFWGKKYTATNINQPFTGDVIDMRYSEIPVLIGNGWTNQWDSNAFCPYLIKDDQSKIITYDNQLSIGYKCDYAKSKNLGGVMIWALGYDVTSNGQELIESINANYLNNFQDDNDSFIAKDFLLNTYPNPFNSRCVIEYRVFTEQSIQIDLFSIKGEFINKIFHGYRSPGKYKYIWNVKNMEREISSGVFLIVINGNRTRSVQKVIYLK